MDAVPDGRIDPKTKRWLNNLSEYLEEDLIPFGSVLRKDFIRGKSDLDLDIFPQNEYSTMAKMCHFCHVHRRDFKKIVWIIRDANNGENIDVYGYKLKYEMPQSGGSADVPLTSAQSPIEFSIYNRRFMPYVLTEHKNKQILPFFVTVLLFIVKIVHYKLEWIDEKQYSKIKRFLMTTLLGVPNDRFFAWS